MRKCLQVLSCLVKSLRRFIEVNWYSKFDVASKDVNVTTWHIEILPHDNAFDSALSMIDFLEHNIPFSRGFRLRQNI